MISKPPAAKRPTGSPHLDPLNTELRFAHLLRASARLLPVRRIVRYDLTNHPGRARVTWQSFTPEACLPDVLRWVLFDVAQRFGTIIVTSTHRSAERNKRVGGVGGSLHLQCRAIDFVLYGDRRRALRYLRTRPKLGWFKYYRRKGHFHIDDGPRRLVWR
ncbi:MAG: D-Ala-D-Ala carboxypeptidase family metallohydrolase [Pseudomonadota bacterium]